MSMNDPVADFLTRIRNATMRKHASLISPSSNIRVEIAKVLEKEGFIENWNAYNNESGLPELELSLKYDKNGESVIRGLKRISSPGLRRHAGFKELPKVYSGQGIAIVTTSKGVLTDHDCRQQKVGGEVLAHVW